MSWSVLTGRWQDVLKVERVDHVITDPPYSERVHSKSRSGRGLPDVKDFGCRARRAVDFGFAHVSQEEREACADMIERVCSRWALIFSDVESCHLWRGAFTEFEAVRVGAWVKLGGSPQFTGDRPGVGFEAVNIMHPTGKKRWNGGGSQAIWSYPIVANRLDQQGSRVHTTQKPIDLMLRLVELFTDPGDTVLDPYCGSGTTGVACLRLGRNFVGCEMDETYAETARERLRAEECGVSLQSARCGQVPLFSKEQQ